MNSIDQLKIDLNYITSEKTLVYTQIITIVDVLCFFILSTLSALNICWIPLFGIIGIFGTRKKSEKLLNVQFVYSLASIPLRIILTSVYHNHRGVVVFGIFSLISCIATVILVYRCSILLSDTENNFETGSRTPQAESAGDPV